MRKYRCSASKLYRLIATKLQKIANQVPPRGEGLLEKNLLRYLVRCVDARLLTVSGRELVGEKRKGIRARRV